jgi:flagellin
VGGAQAALTTVDAAINTISSSRASLGAYQARFASVVVSLQTSAENTSAARSRVQDADFAVETANLSRAQILQQAGTAMVAQANQMPQGVLALLR